jgi:hypothetical protein
LRTVNWTYGSVQPTVWTLNWTVGSGPVQVQKGSNWWNFPRNLAPRNSSSRGLWLLEYLKAVLITIQIISEAILDSLEWNYQCDPWCVILVMAIKRLPRDLRYCQVH